MSASTSTSTSTRQSPASRVVVVAGLALLAACACGPPWQQAVDGFNRSIDDAIDEVGNRLADRRGAVRRWRDAVLPPPPPTLRRQELTVGASFPGVRVDDVGRMFAARFDVAALPWGTPISVWTLGDDVVAAEVHRAVDDGGPILAAPAFVDDGTRESSGRIAFYDDDGAALDGPFVARPVAWRSVSSRYGPRRNPFTGKPAHHRGVDLSAPTGTPVVSVGDGVVVVAGFHQTAGNHVVVRHPGGLLTRYFHLDAIAADVVAGAKIRRGQGVGVVGATGAVTGPHLHFEVVTAGGLTDPLRLEWPAGPMLPKASRAAHQALVAQLRAMPVGAELLAWPPPAPPEPATAPLAAGRARSAPRS